jgi:hypothetical protein
MDRDEYELADISDQETQEEETKLPTHSIARVEDLTQKVHFKIKDFLYTTGEYDLLSYWVCDDTSIFLYKDSYLDMLNED